MPRAPSPGSNFSHNADSADWTAALPSRWARILLHCMETPEAPLTPALETVRITVREAQRDLPRLVQRVVVGRVTAVRLTSGEDAKAVLVSEQPWRRLQPFPGACARVGPCGGAAASALRGSSPPMVNRPMAVKSVI